MITPEFLSEAVSSQLVQWEKIYFGFKLAKYLSFLSQALQLQILSTNRMSQAMQEFVDKDEKDAISSLVKWQLDTAQKYLIQRNIRDDNIQDEIERHVSIRKQREMANDEADAEEVRKVSTQ